MLLGVAQEVVAALAVLRQPQPAWHLSTTLASLLSNVEVPEDMPEPRRVVLLLPLRRVNSDHLVRLEEEVTRQPELVDPAVDDLQVDDDELASGDLVLTVHGTSLRPSTVGLEARGGPAPRLQAAPSSRQRPTWRSSHATRSATTSSRFVSL